MSKFVPDVPKNFYSSEFYAMKQEIENLKKEIAELKTDFNLDKKELSELKNNLTDTVRTRNMIIRSYSKNGMVSKFMPEIKREE